MKNLVIVESPTKARTITKFLSKDYRIESSFGHVRDLPERKLGVAVDKNFEPEYVIPTKAKKQVEKLTELAAKADNIILATDEDREGEAIAWHLREILKPKKYSRITFHEITKDAINKALEHPRDIKQPLVDAQQARRVLDRLVGYELSPFLWKKVAKGLSAGRVQSVAVRLVVDKEREREKFNIEEYWTIEAVFDKNGATFVAKLQAQSGKTLDKLAIKNDAEATTLLAKLNDGSYKVAEVTRKESHKKAPTPFTTSTLQQSANNKLNFSAKQTMMLAQQLYEGVKLGAESVGLITYMRTDSLNLSESFLTSARDFLKKNLGEQYVTPEIVHFKTKSKGAQEAHEAIRPTHVHKTPDSVKAFLDAKQFKLYKLIWERTLATQMPPATIDQTIIDISSETHDYTFRANGQIIKFPGYLKIYKESTKEETLPELTQGDALKLNELTKNEHRTEPPARYTEASLVKVLEEYGIGRPSTYAPTIATIQDRKYIEKEGKALKPTDIGCLVTDILVEHFKDIVDYSFTADMEKSLDAVEEGEKDWQPLIKEFYVPFKANLVKKTKELTKENLTEEKTDEICEKCQSPMIIKTGRFGRFLACSKYPECKNTKQLNIKADGTVEEVAPLDEKCPDCGAPLVEKHGRFGKFIGCSKYPDCKYIQKKNYGTGVTCPECGTGEIVSRRSKRGKIFYGCNRYPECKFVLWQKPTGEKCPDCQAPLVFSKNDEKQCSNASCPSLAKK